MLAQAKIPVARVRSKAVELGSDKLKLGLVYAILAATTIPAIVVAIWMVAY